MLVSWKSPRPIYHPHSSSASTAECMALCAYYSYIYIGLYAKIFPVESSSNRDIDPFEEWEANVRHGEGEPNAEKIPSYQQPSGFSKIFLKSLFPFEVQIFHFSERPTKNRYAKDVFGFIGCQMV